MINKSRNSTEENVKKALNASMKRIENDQLVGIQNNELHGSRNCSIPIFRSLTYSIIVYDQPEYSFVLTKQPKRTNVCYQYISISSFSAAHIF